MSGFTKTTLIVGILIIGMALAGPVWAGGHHGYDHGHGYGYGHVYDGYGPGYGSYSLYSNWDFYAGGQDGGGYFGLDWSAGFRKDYGASGYRGRSGYRGGRS